MEKDDYEDPHTHRTEPDTFTSLGLAANDVARRLIGKHLPRGREPLLNEGLGNEEKMEASACGTRLPNTASTGGMRGRNGQG